MFRTHPKLAISAIVIGIQSSVLWGLAIWSIALIFLQTPLSYLSALFLIGMLLAAGLWTSNIALGLVRQKRWAHTPALILQLLLASIGVASFAGQFGNAVIGVALLVPAAIVFYFLLSGSVRRLFLRD